MSSFAISQLSALHSQAQVRLLSRHWDLECAWCALSRRRASKEFFFRQQRPSCTGVKEKASTFDSFATLRASSSSSSSLQTLTGAAAEALVAAPSPLKVQLPVSCIEPFLPPPDSQKDASGIESLVSTASLASSPPSSPYGPSPEWIARPHILYPIEDYDDHNMEAAPWERLTDHVKRKRMGVSVEARKKISMLARKNRWKRRVAAAMQAYPAVTSSLLEEISTPAAAAMAADIALARGIVGKLPKKRRSKKDAKLETPKEAMARSRREKRELKKVAQEVVASREELLRGLAMLTASVPVWTCRWCKDVHIGPEGHGIRTCHGTGSDLRKGRHVWVKGHVSDVYSEKVTYHLYDRNADPPTHRLKHLWYRVSVVLELCAQAGIDLPGLEMVRKEEEEEEQEDEDEQEETIGTSAGGNDEVLKNGEVGGETMASEALSLEDKKSEEGHKVEDKAVSGPDTGNSAARDDAYQVQLTVWKQKRGRKRGYYEGSRQQSAPPARTPAGNVAELAQKTLDAYVKMRHGLQLLMQKYRVCTCGYCPEVHAGPRGHRIKNCGGPKHQHRGGMHGWMTAEIEDFLPPNYVFHVRSPDHSLVNGLRKFYGMAPSVVELCCQAGAAVPEEFKLGMRLDVVIPELSEAFIAV
ncbi:hypothetical protein CBR_g23288 [Chara braunii]|uniref:APO domain-containing protein n=1 Tax=Chara braunii TaxID=69332 RepID=A0A388L3Z0_CHABU|nr:hypothetical protein CBR_g23288 [Chara braunii]|eukprot:GBG76958.1 hypothetical protein CBR_g23288 [Chara braunii]